MNSSVSTGLKKHDGSPVRRDRPPRATYRRRQRAESLYAQLCGWRTERVRAGSGTYLALELGAVGGGIVECQTPRSLWLPYVEVARIDQATERARDLGAAVLLSPREGPAGWRSVVETGAGAQLAFWQPKR